MIFSDLELTCLLSPFLLYIDATDVAFPCLDLIRSFRVWISLQFWYLVGFICYTKIPVVGPNQKVILTSRMLGWSHLVWFTCSVLPWIAASGMIYCPQLDLEAFLAISTRCFTTLKILPLSLLNLTCEDCRILQSAPGLLYILFLSHDSDVSIISCYLFICICISFNGIGVVFNQLNIDDMLFFNKKRLVNINIESRIWKRYLCSCVKNTFSRFQWYITWELCSKYCFRGPRWYQNVSMIRGVFM